MIDKENSMTSAETEINHWYRNKTSNMSHHSHLSGWPLLTCTQKWPNYFPPYMYDTMLKKRFKQTFTTETYALVFLMPNMDASPVTDRLVRACALPMPLVPVRTTGIVALIFHSPTVFGDRLQQPWVRGKKKHWFAVCELLKDVIRELTESSLMPHRCPKDIKQAKYLIVSGTGQEALQRTTANESRQREGRSWKADKKKLSFYFLSLVFLGTHNLSCLFCCRKSFWKTKKILSHTWYWVISHVTSRVCFCDCFWRQDRLIGDSSWWKILYYVIPCRWSIMYVQNVKIPDYKAESCVVWTVLLQSHVTADLENVCSFQTHSKGISQR